MLCPANRISTWISVIAMLIACETACRPARAQYPHHSDPDKLVVTRGDEVVDTLSCERIKLDGDGRWKNLHVRGHIGETGDGALYAQVGGAWGAYSVVGECRNVMFKSTDQGRTWQRWNVDLPQDRIIGVFAVLHDDTFLAAATQPGDDRINYYSSIDRGKTWQLVSEQTPGPFQGITIGGSLIQLKDGSILSVLHYHVDAPEGAHFSQGVYAGYVLRSIDGGRTWSNSLDPEFWKTLIDAGLLIAPIGPKSRIPGPGGTFPSTYEIGMAEDSNGRVVAAMRFSGPQWPWHTKYVEAWGGKEADDVGRIFRQVMFSASDDGGVTWSPLQPFADADGEPVIVQQETNGQLVPLPDGRLVLVHQRRFGPYQLIARVSNDNGKTWSRDEYRLSAGFGYSGNVALSDGTIVTVVGQSLDGKHNAQTIRWRLPEK